MADENPRKRETELTKLVERRWRLSGLSQPEFVQWLLGSKAQEFGTQTLSKFIRGRLSAPPNGLIQALVERYGGTVEELQKLAEIELKPQAIRGMSPPRETDQVQLQFLVGHTVWAASFVAMMLHPDNDRSLEGVRFASFKDLKSGELHSLRWVRSGRAPGKTPGPLADGELVPLAAPDIIGLMENAAEDEDGTGDGKKVTFGVIPYELAADRQRLQQCTGRYLKLATLIDAISACSIVLPANATVSQDFGLGDQVISSEQLIDVLVKNDNSPRKLILAEAETAAADRALRILRVAQAKFSGGARKDPPILVWGHHTTRDLRTASWKELATVNSGLAAIIAWEPQASWLVRNSAGQAKRFALLDPPSTHVSQDHLTYDICLYIPAERDLLPEFGPWRLRIERAAERLFLEILPKVQQRQASVSNLLKGQRGDLERLSHYYGLDQFRNDSKLLSSLELSQIFSSIRYATSIDPIGMTSALRLGHSYRT